MSKKLTALAVAGALFLGSGGTLVGESFGGGTPKPTAAEVVAGFTAALNKHNYAQACSYYSAKIIKKSGGYKSCRTSLEANQAFALFLGGIEDLWAGLSVIPGSEKVISDTKVTFLIKGEQIPTVKVTVTKGENGNWAISQIG